MTIRTTRNVLLAATAIALFPVLAGCSAGGQPVADACELATNGTTELQTQVAQLQAAVTSGDQAAIGDFAAATDQEISSIGEQITNEEVKPAFERFSSAFSDLTAQTQGLVDIDVTDTDAVTAATEAMTATTTELTDAQTELTQVCGA